MQVTATGALESPWRNVAVFWVSQNWPVWSREPHDGPWKLWALSALESRKGATMSKTKKKAYTKPKILSREKVEVLAAVCDSTWGGGSKTCRIVGHAGCQKARL
jgi:hypothetical protein